MRFSSVSSSPAITKDTFSSFDPGLIMWGGRNETARLSSSGSHPDPRHLIHALVAARLGYADTALRHLRQAATADLEFDPNSAGGIRIAGLGGVWQAVVLGFAGLELAREAISLSPRLLSAWRSLSFAVRWRGRAVQVRIAGATVRVAMSDGEAVDIRIAGGTHRLQAGTPVELRVTSTSA
jgi:trehalose/maltose hydrolase-like predicted phosphorylase